MRYLKISFSIWENESRNKRELSVAQECGAEALVMAKGDQQGVVDNADGFNIHRFSTRPLGEYPLLVHLNRFLSIFLWAHYARSFHADIISGHNLIALLVGYLSTLFTPNGKKARLIYDSPEFELGRNAKRNWMHRKLIKLLEGFLIRRCAFSIMVNDSIADKVRDIYKLQQRPLVIRSTPNYWKLDRDVIAMKRKEMLDALGLNEETFLVMYHGGVVHDRGIEGTLRAVAEAENTAVVILGNPSRQDYFTSLRALCDELKITERVLFLPAVPLSELWKSVGAADVGMVILTATCENHRLCLPNKFFENIQATTPVICSDFPELGRITHKYDIGLTVNSSDITEIATAIKRMRDDEDFYLQCKKNLSIAKEELCWEKEKLMLADELREIDDCKRAYIFAFIYTLVQMLKKNNQTPQNEVYGAPETLCGELYVKAKPNVFTGNECNLRNSRSSIFLLMYHGAVVKDRGIENLMQAVSRTKNTAAIILGNSNSDAYLVSLHELEDRLGIKDRVLFHPAVPLNDLWQYVGAADAGIIVLTMANSESYRLALPNKFFENIQAMTPIVCNDLPEMVKIIDEYKIGLTIDSEDADQLALAIERMRDDKTFYMQCKRNMHRAKEELCWENERLALIAALRNCGIGGTVPFCSNH